MITSAARVKALREALAKTWIDFLDHNPDSLNSPEGLPDHALMTGEQFEDYALAAFDAALASPAPAFAPGCHPSHKTRISLDASSYDEICVNCGATDIAGGGWGKLAEPCPAPVPAARLYTHPSPEPVGLEKAVEALVEIAKHEHLSGSTLAQMATDALAHLSPSPQPSGWRSMDSAPRDGAAILAWCDHEADPHNLNERELTIYGGHCEGLSHVENGPQIVVWGGGSWESTDEYSSGYLISDWWFRFGSEFEEVANPTHWMPLPTPPVNQSEGAGE